jgi:xanthine dehydrogenase accessory factor
MIAFIEKLQELLDDNIPFVSVTMVDAQGSTPQDVGSKMLVTAEGLYYGTVGGGKLEKKALDEALELLKSDSPAKETTRFVSWRLDADVGMTCGGSVKLFFETSNLHTWNIVVFGAGHVGQALIRLLNKLNCRILCVDSRAEWLAKLPDSPKLKKLKVEDMPSAVSQIPEEAFVLLMTMGHSSDKPILLEILKTRQLPYLGVIGSRAKAARLKQDIDAAGLPETCKEAFYCPIGLDIGCNHPEEIAISIVAQLLQKRDTPG